ncbi:GDP-mannose 4,6-dehydratase [Candidatus Margulisiibacteriota bacterium]
MKKALIIGCNGQDGILLEKNLIEKNYQIYGIDIDTIKGFELDNKNKLDISIFDDVKLIVSKLKPDEIYYLAAYHHSSQDKLSENNIELFSKSFSVNNFSLVNFLEAVRLYSSHTKLFYAASSHIFGQADTVPQDENTAINPDNIYGVTKASGVYTCRYYRKNYALFASTGILYNHESSLRSPGFVSKKIIRGAVQIKKGMQDRIELGSLESEIDWGYAPDYVEAMFNILQVNCSDDFIIATGIKHTVKDFVEITFNYLDLDWNQYITINNNIVSNRKHALIGNAEKLRNKCGWKPSVNFKQMIKKLLEEEGIVINE